MRSPSTISRAAAIYSYNPPRHGSLGAPILTTRLTGASDPVTFALTATDKDVWTADAGLGSANEYRYPQGGSPLHACTAGQPIGVAVSPPEIP